MGQIMTRFVQDTETLSMVRSKLCELSKYYPDIYKWWERKVVPGINSGRRMVCMAYYNELPAGLMILKNMEEKKICTLYVFPEYRDQGVGSLFITLAFQVLGTTKPLITVPEPLNNDFDVFLSQFGFFEMWRYPDYYVCGISEVAYNGFLPEY